MGPLSPNAQVRTRPFQMEARCVGLMLQEGRSARPKGMCLPYGSTRREQLGAEAGPKGHRTPTTDSAQASAAAARPAFASKPKSFMTKMKHVMRQHAPGLQIPPLGRFRAAPE